MKQVVATALALLLLLFLLPLLLVRQDGPGTAQEGARWSRPRAPRTQRSRSGSR